MLSLAEENYLKIVYGLLAQNPKGASTNEIALKMNTKASSVTDMIQKLADKNLLNYRKYQGVKTTKQGKELAFQIIRKHRLWEVFLSEKLGFAWDEVHELAEQLEHIQSEELTNRLDCFLGYPKYDPHGDPIPDSAGNIESIESKRVSELKVGNKGIIVGVYDSSDSFLQYLSKHNLNLGVLIEILDLHEFDNSMRLRIELTECTVSREVCNNLKVKLKNT
jgi:DtxR family Mn-dependent transcriptional regulator